MNIKNKWEQTQRDRRIELLVRQAEWVLFQAMISGIDVDQRSVSAVGVARRIGVVDTTKADLDRWNVETGVFRAYAVFAENGDYNMLYRLQAQKSGLLTQCAVAYISWITPIAIFLENRGARWSFTMDIVKNLLSPVGDIKKVSPITKWLGEENISI